MYYIYGRVRAIPTYRVYRLYDIVNVAYRKKYCIVCFGTHWSVTFTVSSIFTQPKERDSGLSYRIGMIMKHRR